MMSLSPRSTLFPYTTLFRSDHDWRGGSRSIAFCGPLLLAGGQVERDYGTPAIVLATGKDRKSTRLNSSHANISYAVFCLKKKIKRNDEQFDHKPLRRHRHL